MKISIIIILGLFFCFSSCKNNEIQNLKNRIDQLERENFDLEVSIAKSKNSFLNESVLFAIPEQKFYKLNEVGKVRFSFIRYDIPSEFNLYYKLNGKKVYLAKDYSEPLYLHEFTPKSLKDSVFHFFAESAKGKDTIVLPGVFKYDVIK